MTTKYKPYAQYSSSYIPWLKEMPNNWKVEKARWLFEKNYREAKEDDDVVTAFRDGTVTLRKNRREDGFTFALKEIGYQGIRTGDLVIHGMDGFAGAIGVSDSDGKASPVYSALTAFDEKEICLDYYAYVFRYMAHIGYIQCLARGIRERSTEFKWPEIRQVELPIPDISEQISISNFLKRITANIDDLIFQKQQLIELLKEKRQALITQAVTNGINPNVKIKDSGVHWLGQIPEHWDIKRLGVVCQLNPGKSEISKLPMDTKVSFVPMELLGENGELNVGEVRDLCEVYEGFTYCKNGDVIVAKITPCFENGKGTHCVGLINGIGMGTTELHVLRPQKIYGKYLYWITREFSFRQIGVKEMRGSAGQQRVPTEFIKNWVVGLPPLEEQQAIVEFLDQSTKKMGEFILLNEQHIALIKEYRQSIITAAVTGKIDLREWKTA